MASKARICYEHEGYASHSISPIAKDNAMKSAIDLPKSN